MSRKRGLGCLLAKYGGHINDEPTIKYRIPHLPPGGEVVMLIPDDTANVSQTVFTSIIECAKEGRNRNQCAAWYLSAIAAIFPDVLVVCKEVFEERGYAVKVFSEHTIREAKIDLQESIDHSAMYAMLGQIILISYKNIDERSYTNYMGRKAQEINTLVGRSQSLMTDGSNIVFSFEKAAMIKRIVGASPKIRKAILRLLLNHRDGLTMRSQLFNYLTKIISWTEMEPIMLVIETFCLTKSPVLQDLRVVVETRNLALAYEKITASEYPQYYRIFNSLDAMRYITRSKFETLVKAARQYRARQKQFAAGSNMSGDTLVNQLVCCHEAHMRKFKKNELDETFKWFTDVEKEELEEEATHLEDLGL